MGLFFYPGARARMGQKGLGSIKVNHIWPTGIGYSSTDCLFVCLGFNGTFSTNRLYRAITVGKYIKMKQYNKPRKSWALFGLGFLEMIPSARLGFLGGVFLANHLASTDNLTRTTKRQNIQQRKLTIHKKWP